MDEQPTQRDICECRKAKDGMENSVKGGIEGRYIYIKDPRDPLIKRKWRRRQAREERRGQDVEEKNAYCENSAVRIFYGGCNAFVKVENNAKLVDKVHVATSNLQYGSRSREETFLQSKLNLAKCVIYAVQFLRIFFESQMIRELLKTGLVHPRIEAEFGYTSFFVLIY